MYGQTVEVSYKTDVQCSKRIIKDIIPKPSLIIHVCLLQHDLQTNRPNKLYTRCKIVNNKKNYLEQQPRNSCFSKKVFNGQTDGYSLPKIKPLVSYKRKYGLTTVTDQLYNQNYMHVNFMI